MSEPTAERPHALRADHVALRVADYDSSVGWYVEKLGFDLDAEWTLDGVPDLRLDGFKLEVIGDGDPETAPEVRDVPDHLRHGGYIHLCLRVDDLDGVLADLGRRGVPALAEPFEVEPIGQRLALIKDNSGNVIELAQAAR